MNFKSILNDVCCDARIKNGVIDLKNPDHVFVLQEYLENSGFDINAIADKTAKLFETGRFPERQAYNVNGILVTFPNKEYRDRAVNKGTHFAENPKKSDVNIFQGQDIATDDSQKQNADGIKFVDKELKKDDDEEEHRSSKEIKQDAEVVQAILTGESPLVNYSVDEAIRCGFYKKGYNWYNSEGTLIGEQIYDDCTGKNKIISPIMRLKKDK